MVDKTLTSLVGGGGIFRVESFVSLQIITAGQTGDLVTIGTAGKTVKLTYITTNTTTAQSGISFDIDGTIVAPSVSLSDYTPVGNSFYIASTTTAMLTGSMTPLMGEFITIKKDAGDTSQDIRFEYEIGEVK